MSRNSHHGGIFGHKKLDVLIGTNGDDVLAGDDGRDLILGRKGNDFLDGGAGNDLLIGGKGNDLLIGGSGNDWLFAGRGDDAASYVLSENYGARDYYDGGRGFDTLQLTLTYAEIQLASVQADIAAFQAFLAGAGHGHGRGFHFSSFDLTVRSFEALNVRPIAQDDAAPTDEDTPVLVNVLANDIDADGSALSVALVAGPEHGTLALNPDGTFLYTPDADFNGEDAFAYLVNDGELDSNVATVTLTVAPVNDKPVASDDAYTTDEDELLSDKNVLDNDLDVDGDALTAHLVQDATHGELVFNADGSFTYTPDLDFFGSDSFTYYVNDGTRNSEVATVSLAVEPVNDAPVAMDDSLTGTGGGGPIHVAVVGGNLSTFNEAAAQLNDSIAFDIDAVPIPVATYTTEAAWFTALAGYDVVVIGENGLTTSDYDGSPLFAALRDFVDAGGGVVSTGWFAGEIAAYSSPQLIADADYISPAAASQFSFSTGTGTSITVADPNHPIVDGIPGYTVNALAHELAGAVDASATVLATGGNGLAAIAYDEVGQGLTVYLGSLHMANSAYWIDRTPGGDSDQIFEQAVNWAAGEQGSAAATDEDTPLVIDDALLLANDTDVEGDALAVESVAATSSRGAAVWIDTSGDIVYDPSGSAALQALAAGEVVTDSFDYIVSDGNGGTDTGSVSITVEGLVDVAGSLGDDGAGLVSSAIDADILF